MRDPRRSRWLALLLLASTASVGVSPRAQAQEAGAQADADKSAEYRALIDQALDEFKRKNWPEARVLFRRAHALSPNARTLRGMGVVSYEMRDYVAAVLALGEALTDARQPLTEAQRSECTQLLERARTFVGSYALTLTPAEAELSVDGAAPTRDASGRLLVSLGDHVLRATAEGYLDATLRLAVQGGEQGELRMVLMERTPVASAPVQSVGSTTESSTESPSRGSERALASEPVPALPEPKPGRTRDLRYTWIALSAAAVFGAGAAGSWLAGKTKLDDLDESCARAASRGAPCQRGAVDTGEVKRFERLTNAMIGLSGAALIGTGVALLLEWPRERETEPARVAFDVTPRELVVRGTF